MKIVNPLFILMLVLSCSAKAAVLDLDLKQWTSSESPSSGINSGTWLRLNNDTPTKLENSSGALIGNFDVAGNFSFSGAVTPTYASNASCAGENTCDDDDIIGLVFGWQNAQNHYRLGWSQGDGSNSSGLKDVTGRTGLFLIKEENGRSNTIENWASDFWLENNEYLFEISRVKDEINLIISGMMTPVSGVQGATVPSSPIVTGEQKSISFQFSDSSFFAGKLGIYTESQTAVFSSLKVEVPTPVAQIPSPNTLILLITACVIVLVTKKQGSK